MHDLRTPMRAVWRSRFISALLLWAWCLPLAVHLAAQEQPPSSLELATAMAEELLRQQQDPVLAALEHVELARLAAADAAEDAAAKSSRHVSASDGESPSRIHPSAEVEAYATAVAALARTPDGRTLPALAAAAAHGEGDVRYAAMTALREGASLGQPTSPALLTARRLLLGDPEARIRRQAFEAYCRWADPDDVLALSQALGSAPNPVRDLAVREWLRIERERSAP